MHTHDDPKLYRVDVHYLVEDGESHEDAAKKAYAQMMDETSGKSLTPTVVVTGQDGQEVTIDLEDVL
jgi:hypothetical protein